MKEGSLDIEGGIKNCGPDHSCYYDVEDLQSLPGSLLGLLPSLE